MSLTSRLASVPQFRNMRALLDDVDRLERRAEVLQDILDDTYRVWLCAANKNVRCAPETIALEFVRLFLGKDIAGRAHAILNIKLETSARERACISCSAAMQSATARSGDHPFAARAEYITKAR